MRIDIIKLKKIIKSTGLTDYQFAVNCGITNTTLSEILNGNVLLGNRTLIKICDYVDIVDVRQLLKPYKTIIIDKKKEIRVNKIFNKILSETKDFYKKA